MTNIINNFSNLNEDVIYSSGFIDGEGYVEYKTRLKKNGRGKIYPCKSIRIEVCNTDFTPVLALLTTFNCGSITYPKRRKKVDGNLGKQQIKWTVSTRNAYKVGKLILPFLKTEQRIRDIKNIISYYEK
jgi:hypothetical protein